MTAPEPHDHATSTHGDSALGEGDARRAVGETTGPVDSRRARRAGETGAIAQVPAAESRAMRRPSMLPSMTVPVDAPRPGEDSARTAQQSKPPTRRATRGGDRAAEPPREPLRSRRRTSWSPLPDAPAYADGVTEGSLGQVSAAPAPAKPDGSVPPAPAADADEVPEAGSSDDADAAPARDPGHEKPSARDTNVAPAHLETPPASDRETAPDSLGDPINPPWEPTTSVRPARTRRDSSPPIPSARRVARAEEMLADTGAVLIRHARARRARWIGAAFAGIAAAALVFGGAAAVTAAVSGRPISDSAGTRLAGSAATEATASPSPTVSALAAPLPTPTPTPAPTALAAPAVVDICAIPAVTAALDARDDPGAIAAAGGAEAFRAAVASGLAPCVPLDDPSHVWVVVNKQRPYSPVDYEPAPLAVPPNLRTTEGGELRTIAADALAALNFAAVAEGAGEVALDSGYRSYTTQQSNYGNGGPDVDASVARPGFSEHQSGLAADVLACGDGCGTLDDLASTTQGAWIASNSWRFGWIVRYEEGRTGVTGYMPEPWHLRYIGSELAAAYHDGGWHTLEEFFGLPAAPDYAG